MTAGNINVIILLTTFSLISIIGLGLLGHVDELRSNSSFPKQASWGKIEYLSVEQEPKKKRYKVFPSHFSMLYSSLFSVWNNYYSLILVMNNLARRSLLILLTNPWEQLELFPLNKLWTDVPSSMQRIDIRF